MLNLFIAVIIENFSESVQSDSNTSFSNAHIDQFVDAWGFIQTDLWSEDRYYLPGYTIVKLLHLMPYPMGIKGSELDERSRSVRSDDRMSYITELEDFVRNLKLRENCFGEIFFVDVLTCIVKKQFELQDVEIDQLERKQTDEIQAAIGKSARKKLMHVLEDRKRSNLTIPVSFSDYSNAATGLQMIYRGKKAREAWERIKLEGKTLKLKQFTVPPLEIEEIETTL